MGEGWGELAGERDFVGQWEGEVGGLRVAGACVARGWGGVGECLCAEKRFVGQWEGRAGSFYAAGACRAEVRAATKEDST